MSTLRKVAVLLISAVLFACGSDGPAPAPDASTVDAAPAGIDARIDAAPTFCEQIPDTCDSLQDCTFATGNCTPAQQDVVLQCLIDMASTPGSCAGVVVSLCYDTGPCTPGAPAPVCGNTVCEADEPTTCPADCPAPVCDHDECTVGGPLQAECSTCTMAVCAVDDYCCVTTWDDVCVTAATSMCGPCP